MSNRSIVEFNHDYSHEIDANPEKFVEAISHALRGGDWSYAERFGVRLGVMAHHSNDRFCGFDKVRKEFP